MVRIEGLDGGKTKVNFGDGESVIVECSLVLMELGRRLGDTF